MEDSGGASKAESDMMRVVAQKGVFVEVQQPRDAAPALGSKGARFVGFEASPDDEGIPRAVGGLGRAEKCGIARANAEVQNTMGLGFLDRARSRQDAVCIELGA